MAFAHALHDMWEEECSDQQGLCEAMAHSGHLHGHHLLQHLKKVSFTGKKFTLIIRDGQAQNRLIDIILVHDHECSRNISSSSTQT